MIEAIPPTFYGNHPIIAPTFYAKHPIIAPTFYKTLKKLLYYQIFIVFVLFGTAIWSCVLLTMADWKALWCKGVCMAVVGKENRGLPVGESSVSFFELSLFLTLEEGAAILSLLGRDYLLMNFLPFFTRIWSLVSALTG